MNLFCRGKKFADNEIFFGCEELSKSEYYLMAESNFYSYDFTILPLRLIIEFNGVAFHPKSPDDENWKQPFTNESAAEKFAFDERKCKFAKDMGFDVLVIWSDEKVSDNVNKIKEVLREKYRIDL